MSTLIDSKQAEPKKVVLRDERDASDSRYLSASYARNGDLQIEGQDLGAEVESIFQCREYEWSYLVKACDLPRLAQVLQVQSNLLGALELWARQNPESDVSKLLKENEITYDFWSRVGD